MTTIPGFTAISSLNVSPRYGAVADLPGLIAAAAGAGFDAVGLDVFSLRAHAADGLPSTEVARLVDAAGLRCAELAYLPISGDVAADSRALQEILPLVEALRPTYLLAVVPTAAQPDTVRRALADAAVRAGVSGTRVALEFGPVLGVPDLRSALRLLDAPALSGVTLCVDTWHVLRGAATVAELETLDPDRIGYVQLADALPRPGVDPRDESVHDRVMPTADSSALQDVTAALAGRFGHRVVVEVLSRSWRARSLSHTAAAAVAGCAAVWPRRNPPPRS